MPRRALLLVPTFALLPALVGAYTEVFYVCQGGDGTLPETATCATAYDAADFNTAGNWDIDDSDDGKIGPNDDVVIMDDGGDVRTALTIQTDGLSGLPITIKAESGGAPILNAADLKTLATDWRGYQHSDGFETGDFEKWDQQNTAGSNTATVETGAARTGTFGMSSTFDGTNQDANTQVDLGAASSDITITFYIRLNSGFSSSQTFANHGIVTFTSAGANRAVLQVRQQATGTFSLWAENVGPFGAVEIAISVNTWHKVVFQYIVSATVGGVSLEVDDGGASTSLTHDTSGDTIDRYFVGGYPFGSLIVDANDFVDFDDIVVTVGDTVNTDAYRSKNTTTWDTASSKGLIIQGGLHLEPIITSIAALVDGQYYHDAADFVWVFPTGGGSPGDYTTQQSTRNNAVDLNGKDFITFSGIDFRNTITSLVQSTSAVNSIKFDSCAFRNAYFYGVYIFNGASDDITIKDSTFREIRLRHIFVDGTDTAGKNTTTISGNTFTMDGEGYTCKDASESALTQAGWLVNAHDSAISNNTVNFLSFFDDSTVFDNTNESAFFITDSDAFTFESNTINGGRHGLQFQNCIGATIQYNRFVETRDDSIWANTGNTGTLSIRYNVMVDSGDDGVSVESPIDLYNNTIARVSDTGITLFSTGVGSNIKNNIIYGWGRDTDDAIEGYRPIVRFADATITNNLWYSVETQAVQNWFLSPDNHTFAEWLSHSHATDDLNADPLLTAVASGTVTLRSTSPAINAGTDVSLSRDFAGTIVPLGLAQDMGAYEWRDSGRPTLGGLGPGIALCLGAGDIVFCP